MRIATRGWTSSAASSEAQVLRVPCTVIRGTLAATMQRSKLRLKLRGSIGVPYLVVKTRPVSIKAARRAAPAATARTPFAPAGAPATAAPAPVGWRERQKSGTAENREVA